MMNGKNSKEIQTGKGGEKKRERQREKEENTEQRKKEKGKNKNEQKEQKIHMKGNELCVCRVADYI